MGNEALLRTQGPVGKEREWRRGEQRLSHTWASRTIPNTHSFRTNHHCFIKMLLCLLNKKGFKSWWSGSSGGVACLASMRPSSNPRKK
jgi:hypothetical protein